MTKYVSYVSFVALLALGACQNQGLNPEALDLNRYITNLSESQDKFPAYVKLMTPEYCVPMTQNNVSLTTEDSKPLYPTIPCEVKKISDYFSDKSKPKQLRIVGTTGLDNNVRVYALAASSKDIRVIQVRSDQLQQDAKIQNWTDSEKKLVLDAVLRTNHSEETVFFFERNMDVDESYRAIMVSDFASYGDLIKSKKSLIQLSDPNLNELISYSNPQIALLSFAFLQGHGLLEVIDHVLESQKQNTNALLADLIFAQYQLRNRETKSNRDIYRNILATSKIELTPELIDEVSQRVLNEANYFVELPKFMKFAEAMNHQTNLFKALAEAFEKIRLVKE